MKEEFSVLVGGKAGQGIKWAAETLGKFFTYSGLEVFVYHDYESVIRGGHNFSIVRISKEKVYAHLNKIDVIVAFDINTVKLHEKKLAKEGKIICDVSLKHEAEKLTKKKIIALPLNKFGKSANAAGIAACLLIRGFDTYELLKIIKDKRISENIVAVNEIEQILGKKETINSKHKLKINKKREFLNGSETIAEGLIAAGLQRYFAYPMTPSSIVLHYLAKQQKRFGLAIQPENEIAVANLALGSAYAGCKTAVGTSGGGFDLMHEALSLSGMAEIPFVVVMAQRAGPSTGVPTYSSQSDLMSVINAGHGEFPRFVVAPATIEDAFYWSSRAMNIAWQFQIPSIILVDKMITESDQSVELDRKKTKNMKFNIAFPGSISKAVKVSSNEHDEQGFTTENPEIIKKMQEKRMKKRENLIKFLHQEKRVRFLGELNSKNIVFCWSSTLGALVEAKKMTSKKFEIVAPIILEPFPKGEIRKAVSNAKKIICIEANATGQLASLLKQKLCIDPIKILKYDARPFDPLELARKLEEVL